MSSRAVTIVVPTYEEAENIPELVAGIERVAHANALDIELLLCDDNSQDGTRDVVEALNRPWVRLITRTVDRGLSAAVIEGLRNASNDLLVVMDADLSHPPEAIPRMLDQLDQGFDFVIGSRYIEGGSTDADWGLFRWINSKVATFLARPFTSIKDPMSGFFAIKRPTFEHASELNPIGYKVGLELIVKCGCGSIAEVPIHFTDRRFGESKLNLKEQLKYLRHLRRLAIYKYPGWSNFLQFAVVGASGTVVNLIVLTALVAISVSDRIALAGGIGVSFLSNFVLNRRFTFSYARKDSIVGHFFGFLAASALGLVTNYSVALIFRENFAEVPIQIAAMVGIIAGMGLNYLMSRYLVFGNRARG
ncbi:MAG: glycosyltransferase family 2 protein [Deltaproteobacteria bacterium]|nr:glycosyltransferase family 2 protein [Deltaproteobacteria bacterium]